MADTDFSQARSVNSVQEEYQVVHAAKCACGAPFAVQGQSLVKDPRTGRPYDQLEAKCVRCATARTFLFDIHSFFGKRARASPSQSSGTGCLVLIWGVAVAAAAGGVVAWVKGAPILGFLGMGVVVLIAWLFWPVKRPPGSSSPAPAPDSGEEMAGTLATLGIPLDMGVGDPKEAMLGGMAKARIFQSYRAMQEGKKEEAIAGFTATLGLLEGSSGSRWTAIRAVALRLRAKLLEESGRAAEALSDYDQLLALVPGDPEAQAGKARLSSKAP